MYKKKCYIALGIIVVAMCITKPIYSVSSNVAREVFVNVAQKLLYVTEGDSIVKEYPVAVGKASTKTPLGEYNVINKSIDPYYRKLRIKGGSEENPLGTRWLGFKYQYGIHGNSDPNSIGTYASGGCIRMYERDVQELYNMIDVGTPVNINYEPLSVMADINGKNTIIKAYKDKYHKIKNYKEVLIERLKMLNIYNDICEERLNLLLNKIELEDTIFSKSWCFFVNEKYITDDIIIIDGDKYVNKNMIQKYFKIDIPSSEYGKKAVFLGQKIEQRYADDVKYIKVKDIKQVLNVNVNMNEQEKSIYLKGDICVVNGQLLGGVSDITTSPKVLFNAMNELYDFDLSVSEKLEISYNGENIEYITEDENLYLILDKLKEKTGFKFEVSTFNHIVSIWIDPIFILNDNLGKGMVIDNKLYIPVNLIMDSIEGDIKEGNVDSLDKEYIQIVDDKSYILFNKVTNLFAIKKDSYNTNFILQRK